MGVDGCRRFSTVFDGFQQFSIVFDGFQLFSIVFNGLSLHEVNTKGVMWSVIGEVFFFSLILFLYYFIFWYVFQKPTSGSPGCIWGLPPYPQQCEGHASRIMWGMSQTIVWGASWNLGQRIINAWVFNP